MRTNKTATPYNAVDVWGSEAARAGRRFKMVVGKWNANGRSGKSGSVGPFAVSSAAVEFHTYAVRAWREALKAEGDAS